MAYPVIEKAYGLRPVRRVDGLPYAGAVRHIPIAAQYGTSIGVGEPVKLSSGTIVTAGATDVPVGVFMGCSYTNPTTMQKTFSQLWPAGTNTPDAMAYVVDDPMMLFQVAVVATASTAITSIGRADVGKGAKLKSLGTPTLLGNSIAGIDDGAVAATEDFMLRIVDVVEESYYYSGGALYREALVMFNAHAYHPNANFS